VAEDPTARALRLVREEWTAPYREALATIAMTACREWCEDKANSCGQPAEFVLWGKLFPPEALGPRCYDHAAAHVGHRGLGDPSWAIIDLRPARAVLGLDATPGTPAERHHRELHDGTLNEMPPETRHA
jgi:hypothetical protein